MAIIERIESRQAAIGIVGLGYVGVSAATALAVAGFRVIGVEVDAGRVAKINAGTSPIEGIEPELPELLSRVNASGLLTAATSYESLRDADVVLIAVDTPVSGDNRPRFESLRSACRELGKVMKRGCLVIVESTLAPGTTSTLVAPLLEKHSGMKADADFLLGHCPQRVMPGRLLKNLRELSRVCGGSSPAACDAMVALYRTIVTGKLTTSDCTTAELVKTAENTYRDVNIAFANELASICEAVGADFREVRRLVNESPSRDVHMAGAGVGGHCIPKDPWLLLHGLDGFETSVIAAARARNEAMPLRMARLVESALEQAGTRVHGAKIAVLGYAYLENSAETRNSPSEALCAHLREWGARVVIHDPWVTAYAGDLWSCVEGADAAIIMVAHDAYAKLDLARLERLLKTPVLVDGRHVIETEDALAHGFVFRALGRGRRRVL